MHSLQPRERDMLNQHHLALVVPASEKFTVALPRRKPNSEYRSREHLTEQVGEMIEFINGSGLGAIGTPEACAAQIERLWQQSKGGFGAYLMLAHNWANPQATLRSYELIAREVMPQFQGHAHSTLDAARRAKEVREGLAAAQSQAVEDARARYEAELATRH